MDTFSERPAPTPTTSKTLERALQRLELIHYAVQEVHYEVDYPTTPDQKADFLIAVENLAIEVLDLVNTARSFAWGYDHDSQELPEDR